MYEGWQWCVWCLCMWCVCMSGVFESLCDVRAVCDECVYVHGVCVFYVWYVSVSVWGVFLCVFSACGVYGLCVCGVCVCVGGECCICENVRDVHMVWGWWYVWYEYVCIGVSMVCA